MFDNKVAGLSVRIHISNRQCGKIKGRKKNTYTNTFKRIDTYVCVWICRKYKEFECTHTWDILACRFSTANMHMCEYKPYKCYYCHSWKLCIIVIRCFQVCMEKCQELVFAIADKNGEKKKYCKSWIAQIKWTRIRKETWASDPSEKQIDVNYITLKNSVFFFNVIDLV